MTMQECATALRRLAIALEESGYWQEFAHGLLARAAENRSASDRRFCIALAADILGQEVPQ